MGSGIAQVAAQSGHNVTLVDLNEQVLQKSKGSIEKSLQRVAKKMYKDQEAEAKKFITDSVSRISVSSDLKDVVKNTDLVVEAIVEKMEVKHKLFSEID
ncbi:3-hydroxybutyryl-CoA dehydrogenase, partial [bacterium LRH843]|nr:3-hydroxybutyryl-CoA dehydrogenase [bacterium LRH843]